MGRKSGAAGQQTGESTELRRAARDLEAGLQDGGDKTLEELTRSQRLLAQAALNRSRRDDDEDEDDLEKASEDEDDEEYEREENEDDDDEDEERREDDRGEVRRSRRGNLRRSEPRDGSDLDARRKGEFNREPNGKRGKKMTNEDADHEEDEPINEGGEGTADGPGGRGSYGVGRDLKDPGRALRRSRGDEGMLTQEELFRSAAAVPGMEDAINAEPILEDVYNHLGRLAEDLRKSARGTANLEQKVDIVIGALAPLTKAVATLLKDTELIKSQPVTANTPWGLPAPRRAPASGKGDGAGEPLAKSRGDVLAELEPMLRSGEIDPTMYARLSRLGSVQEMANLLPTEIRERLGLKTA